MDNNLSNNQVHKKSIKIVKKLVIFLSIFLSMFAVISFSMFIYSDELYIHELGSHSLKQDTVFNRSFVEATDFVTNELSDVIVFLGFYYFNILFFIECILYLKGKRFQKNWIKIQIFCFIIFLFLSTIVNYASKVGCC